VVFSFIFIAIVWLLGSNLKPFIGTLLPDQGAALYYWKLPSRNAASMLVVWFIYLAHRARL
jgi:hypothetical protein